jgi:predicted DsbA family dithiol-disulfide isomerase
LIIDVWSDVVCPWCFIGRRRLQKALAGFAHADDVVVRHRAFQLQPEISTVVPTSVYLVSKYRMEPMALKQMQSNVCAIAKGEGLCYELDETLSGNTLDAHRLLLWSDEFGKQDDLLEAMYSGYFEKGLPLFTHTDLLAITDQVGIERDVVTDLLESDRYRAEVVRDGQLAQELGATGVPFFVFDMKYGISGAQSLDAFSQTLETAWSSRVIS